MTSMRLVTSDDIIDVYSKVKQRGANFIFSKLNLNSLSRTKSTFDDSKIQGSNWWMIPMVVERWNKLITGDSQINDKQYLMNGLLKNEQELRLISFGSGYSRHELELAEYSQFKEIICIDLVQSRLLEAEKTAQKRNLKNIRFICSNIEDYKIPENYFDIVYFNQSLHHFKNVENLLETKIKKCLKHSGKLIIKEYVGSNRLQFPPNQIREINNALKLIPNEYKKRFKTNSIKNKFMGPGLLRMIVSDPSECIDSANILPSIHSKFSAIVEKPYGGNILMNVLRDISHHFVDLDSDKEEVLRKLFLFEDAYLTKNSSDFVFGVYEKQDQ